MARRCTGCSARLPEVARFCSRCGSAIARRGAPVWPAVVSLALGAILLTFVVWIVAIPGARSHVYVTELRSTPPAGWPRDRNWTEPATEPPESRLLLPAAQAAGDVVASAAADLEIVRNPHLLLDRAVSASALRLHGVGLNDSRSAIPKERIRHVRGGEVRCTDGNWFDALEGRVVRIVVESPELLGRLRVRRAGEILDLLGHPDAVSYMNDAGLRTIYTYSGRGLSVRWDDRTQRIDQIMLSAAGGRGEH